MESERDNAGAGKNKHTPGVFLQIALMFSVCRVEHSRRSNSCGYCFLLIIFYFARLHSYLQLFRYSFRYFFLLFIIREDGTRILRSTIVTLPV